jgi:hypothetical protein
MPEEVAFFGRSATFGLVIAAIYWFVSYETVGTILLAGFGLASAFAFVVLGRGRPRPRPHSGPLRDAVAIAVGGDSREQPFEDEGGAVPVASAAPFEIGAGLALVGLGLVFGVWFVLAGVLPIAFGAIDWLGSVGRESLLARRVVRDEPPPPGRPPRPAGR